MMAAKLEWVSENRGLWTAGKWEIYVGSDGDYSVHVAGSGPFSRIGVHGSLAEAKDYCEQQEREAAPPVELPTVGSVWGVVGKPETRRLVHWVENGRVGFTQVCRVSDIVGLIFWHSWVQSSGAVRIDGEGKHDSQWREELAKFTDLLEYAKSELDAERTRVRELEAETARLRAINEHASRTIGGYQEEVGDLRAKLAALEKQFAACEDKVATEFERCGRLMEALRGIRDAGNWATNGNQDAGKMRELARETIAREEMVKS